MIKRNQIQMMKDRGYDVTSEEGILSTTEEIFTNHYNNVSIQYSLPFRSLMTSVYQKPNSSETTVVYYAIPLGRTDQLNQETIAKFIEFVRAGKHSTAILITKVPLMSKPKTSIKSIDEFKIQVFMDIELMFNVTKHKIVPRHEILPLEQEAPKMKELSVIKKSQFPYISVNDPVIKYYGWEIDRIVVIERNTIFLDTIARRKLFYRVIIPSSD